MRVFSLNALVHTWPNRAEVISALRSAADELRKRRPEVTRVGYFGSLTDGRRYGFGSDADVVVVVSDTDRSFMERLLDYHLDPLPVSADVLVYTEDEFARILTRGDLFTHDMANAVWL